MMVQSYQGLMLMDLAICQHRTGSTGKSCACSIGLLTHCRSRQVGGGAFRGRIVDSSGQRVGQVGCGSEMEGRRSWWQQHTVRSYAPSSMILLRLTSQSCGHVMPAECMFYQHITLCSCHTRSSAGAREPLGLCEDGPRMPAEADKAAQGSEGGGRAVRDVLKTRRWAGKRAREGNRSSSSSAFQILTPFPVLIHLHTSISTYTCNIFF